MFPCLSTPAFFNWVDFLLISNNSLFIALALSRLLTMLTHHRILNIYYQLYSFSHSMRFYWFYNDLLHSSLKYFILSDQSRSYFLTFAIVQQTQSAQPALLFTKRELLSFHTNSTGTILRLQKNHNYFSENQDLSINITVGADSLVGSAPVYWQNMLAIRLCYQ